MKILITGYKGFIGQNMVKALKNEHELGFYEYGDRYPIIKDYDWVIHLGGISSTTERNVEKLLHYNYDFTKTLIEECLYNGTSIQIASSASVYGNSFSFKESDPVQPLSPYAWSKYLTERFYEQNKSTLLTICNDAVVQFFRYFNVWGPCEEHKGNQASPFIKFKKELKEKGYITVFKGPFKRDFIHVDEVVKVHKAFFKVYESGIWNVGTGDPATFYDVARYVGGNNVELNVIELPTSLRSHYQEYTCADLTKLKEYIGEGYCQRSF